MVISRRTGPLEVMGSLFAARSLVSVSKSFILPHFWSSSKTTELRQDTLAPLLQTASMVLPKTVTFRDTLLRSTSELSVWICGPIMVVSSARRPMGVDFFSLKNHFFWTCSPLGNDRVSGNWNKHYSFWSRGLFFCNAYMRSCYCRKQFSSCAGYLNHCRNYGYQTCKSSSFLVLQKIGT